MGRWDITALEKLKQAQEAKKTLKRPAKKIHKPKETNPTFYNYSDFASSFDFSPSGGGYIDIDSNLQIAIRMLREKHPNLRVKIMTNITPNGYVQVVFEGITTLRLTNVFMMEARVDDLVNEFEKAITYKPIEKAVGIGGKRSPTDDWTDKWLKENS